MKRPIGFWVSHSPALCPGNFSTPSIVTRTHYSISTPQTRVYIEGGCASNIVIGNDALSSFQNAQLSVVFGSLVGKLELSLSVGGIYNWMPVVQVDGISRLTGAGTATVALTSGAHTLNFSMNPAAPGSVPADGFSLSAAITF